MAARLGGFKRDREIHGTEDQGEAYEIIPCELFLEHNPGKDHENAQSDDFLDDLELVTGEGAALVAGPIGWHHEAILEKGDAPGRENDKEQGFALEEFELQLPIPSNGHEDVRES